VIGFKCAGKTTLSDHLAAQDDVMVVEASSVLRSLAQDAEQSVETADDAFKFLTQHGLDCVAHTIGNFIERGTAKLYVVTGLRTVEEILLLTERFPQANVVLVDIRPCHKSSAAPAAPSTTAATMRVPATARRPDRHGGQGTKATPRQKRRAMERP